MKTIATWVLTMVAVLGMSSPALFGQETPPPPPPPPSAPDAPEPPPPPPAPFPEMEEMKKEFLISKLELSEKDGEKFWKIHESYDAKRKKLREEHKKSTNPMLLTDAEAKAQLDDMFDFETQSLKLKKDFYKDLESVLNTRQLLYLHQLENDFRKRVIQQFRKRMDGRQGQGRSRRQ